MLRFERLMTGMSSSQNMPPVSARDSSGLLEGKPCIKKGKAVYSVFPFSASRFGFVHSAARHL